MLLPQLWQREQLPALTVIAAQLSQAGASDWKSANCSLRAVLGPVSLGMMPARASSAAAMSGSEPFAVPFLWPLPLVVWPFVAPVEGDDFLAWGFVLTEPPAEPGADLVAGFGAFSAWGRFSATGGRGFMVGVVAADEPPAEPGADDASSVASALGRTPWLASL